MVKKYLSENKRGSATLVIIISSFVLMLYANSTYYQVLHMKNMYTSQEKIVLEIYENKYKIISNRLEINTVEILDTTPPTLGTFSSAKLPETIDVTITGATDASGIKNYDFYIDGTKVVTQISNTYSYTSLLQGINYTIKYVVRDNYDNIATSQDYVIMTAARRPYKIVKSI